MDKIHIRRLKVSTIIGTLPEERTGKQDIFIDLTLSVDMHHPGKTDDLQYAVDYSEVENSVVAAAEQSSFHLLEALAEHVADTVLSFDGVLAVEVIIDKPGATHRADSIAVEIRREKNEKQN